MKKNHKNLDFNKLKKLYKKNVNIMKYLRNKKKKDHNSEDDIRLSYELQAGTYLDDLSQKEFAIKNESFCREFSKLFDSLGCKSILQAGVTSSTPSTLHSLSTCLPRRSRAPNGERRRAASCVTSRPRELRSSSSRRRSRAAPRAAAVPTRRSCATPSESL